MNEWLCRLGPVEPDGYAYCHEHMGWWPAGDGTDRCDGAA